MCESWTADDEKALLELQRRREEVMTKRRNILLEIIQSWKPSEFDMSPTGVTNQLIKHADAITEALKPFTRKEGNRTKTAPVENANEQ